MITNIFFLNGIYLRHFSCSPNLSNIESNLNRKYFCCFYFPFSREELFAIAHCCRTISIFFAQFLNITVDFLLFFVNDEKIHLAFCYIPLILQSLTSPLPLLTYLKIVINTSRTGTYVYYKDCIHLRKKSLASILSL